MLKQQNAIIGHENIIAYLDKVVEQKSTAHAYIFSGLANVGKKTVLESFINKLLCDDRCQVTLKNKADQTYSDFFYLEAEEDKKNISIKQVRELIHSLSLTSFSNNTKIAVINNAEKLNSASSNALLKVLEEPSSNTIIFLLTTDCTQLLETIQSRSVIIRFYPVSQKKIETYVKEHAGVLSHSDLESIVALSFGRPGLAVGYLTNDEKFAKIKERTNELFDVMGKPLHQQFSFIKEHAKNEADVVTLLQLLFRDILAIKANSPELVVHHFALEKLRELATHYSIDEIVKIIERLQEFYDAQKYNINSTLFLENIFLHA